MRYSFVAVLAVCVLVCTLAFVACACTPTYTGADPSHLQHTRFVAHRGINEIGDLSIGRNTAQSFAAAAASPYVWGIETDLWLTSDGVLVCMHDPDAVSGIKDVRTVPSDQVLAAPLADYNETYYAPTYDTYLSICNSGNKVAVVEIKDPTMTTGAMDSILSKAAQAEVELCIISFHYAKLRYVRSVAPDVPCQLLCNGDWSKYLKKQPVGDITRWEDLVADCIDNRIDMSFDHEYLEKREKKGDGLVERLHQAGREVGVWTVDSLQTALYDMELGVDVLTSNRDMAAMVASYIAARS